MIGDVTTPDTDGYDVCRRVKADAGLSDVPVLLLTTLSNPGDVMRGLECGADNIVVAPYREETLVARVRGVLANHDARKVEPGGLGLVLSAYDAVVGATRSSRAPRSNWTASSPVPSTCRASRGSMDISSA